MTCRAALLLLVAGTATGGTARADNGPGSVARVEVHAARLSGAVTIDGILSDPAWQNIQSFSSFVQKDPVENGAPSERTEIQVAYDDAALYIAAHLYDEAPDSVVARLGRKDDKPNSDAFIVYLDPYHDRQSGYYFGLDAAGTVFDGTLYNDDWQDNAWDGVWEGSVSRDAHGWAVEMRIPFSQLRFHQHESNVWGIDFERDIARKNETDFVVFTPKNGSGFVSRFVDLTGIQDIQPARQIEILPYINTKAEYTQHPAGDPFNNGARYTPSVGADFKIGLGSNLTLDGAVNPDFGQVEVDPAVVNLSDVETFYQEKRPFFIEGSSTFNFGRGGSNNYWSFNWGDPNLFYSRRIGRAPQGAVPGSDYSDVPVATRIIGAGKLTGKIGDSWNIGVINAVTGREYASLQTAGVRSSAEIEPLTYYGVFRAQKELNEGRQAIGILSTITERRFATDTLRNQLNGRSLVLGLDGWTFLDEGKSWVITGYGAVSQIAGTREEILARQQVSSHYLQRPDARNFRLDSAATALTGYEARLMLNKQRGNVFVNAAFGIINPEFDNTDLGWLWRTDIINSHAVVGYMWVEPTSWYRRLEIYGAAFGSADFDRNVTWKGLWTQLYYQFPGFHTASVSFAYNPQSLNNRRTRGGPLSLNTPGYEVFTQLQTNNTQNVVLQVGTDVYQADWQRSWDISATLEVRPASNISVSVGPEFFRDVEGSQWVGVFDDPLETSTYGRRYVFAVMNQTTLSANIRVNWMFSPRLSLQLFLQPLISAGDYYNFKQLARPGTYDFTLYGQGASTISERNGTYSVDPDGSGPAAPFSFSDPSFNVKSLRGNAVLRWEYMPGSTLYLVWTQSRYQSDAVNAFQFDRSMRQLVDIAPDNIFMIKLSYWWNQ